MALIVTDVMASMDVFVVSISCSIVYVEASFGFIVRRGWSWLIQYI
jgi:hypothetical protein